MKLTIRTCLSFLCCSCILSYEIASLAFKFNTSRHGFQVIWRLIWDCRDFNIFIAMPTPSLILSNNTKLVYCHTTRTVQKCKLHVRKYIPHEDSSEIKMQEKDKHRFASTYASLRDFESMSGWISFCKSFNRFKTPIAKYVPLIVQTCCIKALLSGDVFFEFLKLFQTRCFQGFQGRHELALLSDDVSLNSSVTFFRLSASKASSCSLHSTVASHRLNRLIP